jgi:transposase
MLHFQPEVYEFVKQHPDMKAPDLCRLINKTFGLNLKYSRVWEWQQKYVKGGYKKKNKPTWSALPVGTEFKRGAQGYIVVRTETGAKPKHHIIWEKEHDPIKPDEVLIFLDGNRENFDLDNLFLTKRRYLSVINRILKDKEVSPETRKTAINLAILKVTISDKEIIIKANKKEVHPLTTLQKKVLDLHLQGLSNFDIATKLGCDMSVVSKTVRKYKFGYYDNVYASASGDQ